MDSLSAFISQPPNVFRSFSGSHVCRGSSLRTCSRHRPRRVLAMSLESESSEANISMDTDINSTDAMGAPEIVEIGDGDIEDEDINIYDALGEEFEKYKEKRKKVRKRTSDIVGEITAKPDTILTSDADRQPPVEEDEVTEYIRTVVRAADQRKGEDILALRISKLTYISSFIVIVTGNNSPQLRAIGNLVEDDLEKEHGLHARRRDGTANSGWLLLDYGDFLVNIFSHEQRRNYNLESLWKNGEELNISDCIAGPEERPVVEERANSLDDWLDE